MFSVFAGYGVVLFGSVLEHLRIEHWKNGWYGMIWVWPTISDESVSYAGVPKANEELDK